MASEREGPGIEVPGPSSSNSVSGSVRGPVVQAGVVHGDVNLLTGVPVRTRYRRQVRRIAPRELIGREPELAELAAFCTSPSTAGTYRWWRAAAWSGKSALMSAFVLHPPPGVRVVSFFITARLAAQNDRGAFTDNVLEQPVTILDQPLPPLLTESTQEVPTMPNGWSRTSKRSRSPCRRKSPWLRSPPVNTTARRGSPTPSRQPVGAPSPGSRSVGRIRRRVAW